MRVANGGRSRFWVLLPGIAALLTIVGVLVQWLPQPDAPPEQAPVPTWLDLRILDADSGRPLEGVRVELPEHGWVDATDALGVLRVELLQPRGRRVRIAAELAGYERLERSAPVGLGQQTWLLKRLEPGADPLGRDP